MKVGVTVVTSGGGNLDDISYYTDVLMASLPWSSGSATKADGSVWCTDWDNKVNKDGTTKTTSTVAYGFDKGKCSF